jgi:hypothetical protein
MNPLENFSPTQAEAFWELLTLHRLAKTGYVAFAMYNSGKDWEALKTALELEPTLNTKIVYVPSGNISSTDPNFLPTLRSFGQERALVLLRLDLSRSDPSFKDFCGYLNFHREEIVAMPHALVVCSTEPSITEVNRQAPDTFAVKRALLDFRGEFTPPNLPLGDSGLWLQDVQDRTSNVEDIEALLEAERNALHPNEDYIARLELRLAGALNDIGQQDIALSLQRINS